MSLWEIDNSKMTSVVVEALKELAPESRSRLEAAIDRDGGGLYVWHDNGDGTVTISWAGVELATVPMGRVTVAPPG